MAKVLLNRMTRQRRFESMPFEALRKVALATNFQARTPSSCPACGEGPITPRGGINPDLDFKFYYFDQKRRDIHKKDRKGDKRAS